MDRMHRIGRMVLMDCSLDSCPVNPVHPVRWLLPPSFPPPPSPPSHPFSREVALTNKEAAPPAGFVGEFLSGLPFKLDPFQRKAIQALAEVDR